MITSKIRSSVLWLLLTDIPRAQIRLQSGLITKEFIESSTILLAPPNTKSDNWFLNLFKRCILPSQIKNRMPIILNPKRRVIHSCEVYSKILIWRMRVKTIASSLSTSSIAVLNQRTYRLFSRKMNYFRNRAIPLILIEKDK